jgi:hypothetical protein
MSALPPLQLALALAGQWLAEAPVQAPRDPYDIELPPVWDGAPHAAITAAAVRALGALYLCAELEQAGLPLGAELLAEHRLALPLAGAGSTEAALALERFAWLQREHWNRRQREALYARLFGLGGAAGGSGSNNDFQRRLAAFALALVRRAEPALPGGGGLTWRDTALRWAAQQLAANLASRPYGHAMAAGRRLQAYLSAAIELLMHPALLRHFAVGGLWPLLARLFGAATPDQGRFVARGQCGLQLLQHLADLLPWLDGPAPLPLPALPVQTVAAQWLAASGLAPRN